MGPEITGFALDGGASDQFSEKLWGMLRNRAVRVVSELFKEVKGTGGFDPHHLALFNRLVENEMIALSFNPTEIPQEPALNLYPRPFLPAEQTDSLYRPHLFPYGTLALSVGVTYRTDIWASPRIRHDAAAVILALGLSKISLNDLARGQDLIAILEIFDLIAAENRERFLTQPLPPSTSIFAGKRHFLLKNL